MSDTAGTAAKSALRRALRQRRRTTDPSQCLTASHNIARSLSTVLADVELLGAFASHDNEVDLFPFYEEWLASGARLAFPRVVADAVMEFCEVTTLDELVPGAFGIREPDTPPIDAALIEAFLVPAVAFDRGGRRLGFGGGYYDRLLGEVLRQREHPPARIGIGYGWQLLDEALPSDPWDIAVTCIVTDAEVVHVE